jgi:hypothetical protein
MQLLFVCLKEMIIPITLNWLKGLHPARIRFLPLKLRLDARTDGFVRIKITDQKDGLTPKGISTRFMKGRSPSR